MLLAVGSYPDAAAEACKARDADLLHAAIHAFEKGLAHKELQKSLYFLGVINRFPMETVHIFTTYYSRFGELRGGDVRPSIHIFLRRQKHTEATL